MASEASEWPQRPQLTSESHKKLTTSITLVSEGGAVEATVRAADSVAAPPDPHGGAAHAARLRQAVRDVPRPLRRPPHHHAQEKGSLQKGAIVRPWPFSVWPLSNATSLR